MEASTISVSALSIEAVALQSELSFKTTDVIREEIATMKTEILIHKDS